MRRVKGADIELMQDDVPLGERNLAIALNGPAVIGAKLSAIPARPLIPIPRATLPSVRDLPRVQSGKWCQAKQ